MKENSSAIIGFQKQKVSGSYYDRLIFKNKVFQNMMYKYMRSGEYLSMKLFKILKHGSDSEVDKDFDSQANDNLISLENIIDIFLNETRDGEEVTKNRQSLTIELQSENKKVF